MQRSQELRSSQESASPRPRRAFFSIDQPLRRGGRHQDPAVGWIHDQRLPFEPPSPLKPGGGSGTSDRCHRRRSQTTPFPLLIRHALERCCRRGVPDTLEIRVAPRRLRHDRRVAFLHQPPNLGRRSREARGLGRGRRDDQKRNHDHRPRHRETSTAHHGLLCPRFSEIRSRSIIRPPQPGSSECDG